jgi:hypothetical protein
MLTATVSTLILLLHLDSMTIHRHRRQFSNIVEHCSFFVLSLPIEVEELTPMKSTHHHFVHALDQFVFF